MDKVEFRKIQKILSIALTQAEKEAIADGDVIWLSIMNQTDATDFTVRHLNANLDRI
jgi:hypothetical protein